MRKHCAEKNFKSMAEQNTGQNNYPETTNCPNLPKKNCDESTRKVEGNGIFLFFEKMTNLTSGQ